MRPGTSGTTPSDKKQNRYHYNPDLNPKPEKITVHESSKSNSQRPTQVRRRQLIKKTQESFDLRTILTNKRIIKKHANIIKRKK